MQKEYPWQSVRAPEKWRAILLEANHVYTLTVYQITDHCHQSGNLWFKFLKTNITGILSPCLNLKSKDKNAWVNDILISGCYWTMNVYTCKLIVTTHLIDTKLIKSHNYVGGNLNLRRALVKDAFCQRLCNIHILQKLPPGHLGISSRKRQDIL